MKTHKPLFYKSNKGNIVYHKVETDNNFLHRNTESISINVENLEKCDIVHIKLSHLDVEIFLTKEACKDKGHYMSFKSSQTGKHELKLYVPVNEWTVIKGDKKWYLNVLSVERLSLATGTMKTKVSGYAAVLLENLNINAKKF